MILVIRTQWNSSVTEKLAAGAKAFLNETGYEVCELEVPGA